MKLNDGSQNDSNIVTASSIAVSVAASFLKTFTVKTAAGDFADAEEVADKLETNATFIGADYLFNYDSDTTFTAPYQMTAVIPFANKVTHQTDPAQIVEGTDNHAIISGFININQDNAGTKIGEHIFRNIKAAAHSGITFTDTDLTIQYCPVSTQGTNTLVQKNGNSAGRLKAQNLVWANTNDTGSANHEIMRDSTGAGGTVHILENITYLAFGKFAGDINFAVNIGAGVTVNATSIRGFNYDANNCSFTDLGTGGTVNFTAIFTDVDPQSASNVIQADNESVTTVIVRDMQITVSTPAAPPNQAYIDDGVTIVELTEDYNGKSIPIGPKVDIGINELGTPNSSPGVSINTIDASDLGNILLCAIVSDIEGDVTTVTKMEFDATGNFSGSEIDVTSLTTGDFGPHGTAAGPVVADFVIDLSSLLPITNGTNAKFKITANDGTSDGTDISDVFPLTKNANPLTTFQKIKVDADGNITFRIKIKDKDGAVVNITKLDLVNAAGTQDMLGVVNKAITNLTTNSAGGISHEFIIDTRSVTGFLYEGPANIDIQVDNTTTLSNIDRSRSFAVSTGTDPVNSPGDPTLPSSKTETVTGTGIYDVKLVLVFHALATGAGDLHYKGPEDTVFQVAPIVPGIEFKKNVRQVDIDNSTYTGVLTMHG